MGTFQIRCLKQPYHPFFPPCHFCYLYYIYIYHIFISLFNKKKEKKSIRKERRSRATFSWFLETCETTDGWLRKYGFTSVCHMLINLKRTHSKTLLMNMTSLQMRWQKTMHIKWDWMLSENTCIKASGIEYYYIISQKKRTIMAYGLQRHAS